MSRTHVLCLYFLAVFLQAGAYGLTFLLPDLFASFGANEKQVGQNLGLTAIATLTIVYYSGHLADLLGRLPTLGLACMSIAVSLALYGASIGGSFGLVLAALLLGIGWGLTYALAPVALTRVINKEESVRYFAMLSIFVMAGFGLSPVMAAQIAKLGFGVDAAFFAIATLSALAGFIFFALTKPMRNLSQTKSIEPPSKLTLKAVKKILASPAWLPVAMVCLGASVFAGMNNFQTVFAAERGLNFASYFLAYTITVILLRGILAAFKGGKSPYLTISILQYVMALSVILFIVMGSSQTLYILVAVLFGLGYGASYPILVAVCAQDARNDLLPQTLQLFALTYFIGIFGFPLVAGWIITELGSQPLLILAAGLAILEASLALSRGLAQRRIP